ncbi:MAG TPA: hypothetical protein VFZ76_13195, partial [Anaerolineales bacterium]
ILILATLMLTSSALAASDQQARVRAFTRPLEFDYVSWTLEALGIKLEQAALGTHTYLPPDDRSQLVFDYLDLVSEIQRTEAELNQVFADPDIRDPQAAASPLVTELERLNAQRHLLGPLAESIVQDQISVTVAEFGLALGGQPIPPVLYHTSPLPTALIVSPRDVIRQDENISLQPDLRVDLRAEVEEQVDTALNVSSLVVDVGGIGIYPTMVLQTSNLDFLTEVVAHEWTHNFLTLRPLGLNYLKNAQLRTMNETAASIAGREIGRAVLERYYPEQAPPRPPPLPPETAEPITPPAFDFRAEMRETRVTADRLLAEGKIDEAEAYMEVRRRFFIDNGYAIRKLNQAYFAFHGAYADQPGGAAGEDPVGAAVRQLREDSPSLAAFLKRIAWMTSFEELQQALGAF